MFGFGNSKHKRLLQQAFSDCFEPLKDELGNVPLGMQKSPEITASVLGVCRGYTNSLGSVDESSFDLIVDAVFEELFRRESVEVQNRAEKWLHESDEDFMKAYYHAKSLGGESLDLSWLREYAQENFEPATGKIV